MTTYGSALRSQQLVVTPVVTKSFAGLARALASKDATEVGTFGRALPREGRPLGFHMTRIILAISLVEVARRISR